MSQTQIKTLAQVREEFARKGTSYAAWARQHGLSPSRVYDVMQGRNKGRFGEAHTAAVLLGLKEGETNTTNQ